MIKHTKGNWSIVEGNTFCAIRVDERVIVDMRLVNLHYNKADAKLIAAAPDLLQALIAMTDLFDLTNQPFSACREVAAIAIAKATGEQA